MEFPQISRKKAYFYSVLWNNKAKVKNIESRFSKVKNFESRFSDGLYEYKFFMVWKYYPYTGSVLKKMKKNDSITCDVTCCKHNSKGCNCKLTKIDVTHGDTESMHYCNSFEEKKSK